jgi:hypothetical protein
VGARSRGLVVDDLSTANSIAVAFAEPKSVSISVPFAKSQSIAISVPQSIPDAEHGPVAVAEPDADCISNHWQQPRRLADGHR